MGKYQGLRRFTTKRFILTVATMSSACVFLYLNKLPPGWWVLSMLGSAAYHSAADIIGSFKGIVGEHHD